MNSSSEESEIQSQTIKISVQSVSKANQPESDVSSG